MSYEVFATFPHSSFFDLINRLKSLPSPFAPEYFTWGERVRNKADRVDDIERFEPFLQRGKKVSFCLVGNKISYDIAANAFRDNSRNPTDGRVLVEVKKGFKSRQNFNQLLPYLMETIGSKFGFACNFDESNARHRVVKKWEEPELHGGASSVEFNVGTDFRNYIPGLYWVTAFELEYLLGNDITPEIIGEIAVENYSIKTTDGRTICYFKFFEKPDDWERHSEKIDEFCYNHPQFFSMQRLIKAIGATQSEEELNRIVSPWVR